MSKPKIQYIVVSGTPADGFAFWGPLEDPDAAASWAESNLHGDWWVTELEAV
jgi:hypothetical protein